MVAQSMIDFIFFLYDSIKVVLVEFHFLFFPFLLVGLNFLRTTSVLFVVIVFLVKVVLFGRF